MAEEMIYGLTLRLYDNLDNWDTCKYYGEGEILVKFDEKLAEGYISNDYILLNFTNGLSNFMLLNNESGAQIHIDCEKVELQIPGTTEIEVVECYGLGGIEILLYEKNLTAVESQLVLRWLDKVRRIWS